MAWLTTDVGLNPTPQRFAAAIDTRKSVNSDARPQTTNATVDLPEALSDWGILEERCGVMLRAYVAHQIGDPTRADDIAQESLMRAWQSRARFRPGGDLGAWLRGIARNLILKDAHQRRRFVPLLDEFVEAAWADRDDGSKQDPLGNEKDALARCRQRLTPRLKQLVALRYDENLSCAEVAVKAGVGESAVKVGLLRAREALAKCVQVRLKELR